MISALFMSHNGKALIQHRALCTYTITAWTLVLWGSDRFCWERLCFWDKFIREMLNPKPQLYTYRYVLTFVLRGYRSNLNQAPQMWCKNYSVTYFVVIVNFLLCDSAYGKLVENTHRLYICSNTHLNCLFTKLTPSANWFCIITHLSKIPHLKNSHPH